MRIFSALAETPQTGVTVKQSPDVSYAEVSIDDLIVVAKVSAASLLSMFTKGDAAVAPVFGWSKFGVLGKQKGQTGGVTVFRADCEFKEGCLWLVPEKGPSSDVLYFMRNKYLQHELICDDAAIVSSIEASFLGSCHVAQLSPGGSIVVEDPVVEPIRGEQSGRDLVMRLVAGLSEDGTNLTF